MPGLPFQLRVVRDQISPDIVRKLRSMEDPRPALQAAGLLIESFAKRAFKEPSLRPAPWAALSPKTIKQKQRKRKSLAILIRDAILIRSPRVTSLTKKSVTIGTDRPYAIYHQAGKGAMYRPFFPMDRDGNLTRYAREKVESILRKKLGLPGA